jgi:hypothetical protein
MNLEDLKKAAEECENQGRWGQANLLRQVIVDVEDGVPWLDLMNGEGLS